MATDEQADEAQRKDTHEVRPDSQADLEHGPQGGGRLTVVGIGASAGGLAALQAFFDVLGAVREANTARPSSSSPTWTPARKPAT